MRAYILRRLLALIPTLLFASIIVFVTVRMIPGDIIDLMLSQNDVAADKLSRDQLVSALGLDRSMPEQYVRWVWGVLQGDFGKSLWQSTPVLEQVLQRLPVTFELGLMALIGSTPDGCDWFLMLPSRVRSRTGRLVVLPALRRLR